MCSYAILESQSRAFAEALTSARRVAIVCHMSPDGDALGSSLCLWHTLRAMPTAPEVQIVTPDAPPSQLMFLPGTDSIMPASYKPSKATRIINEADTLVCLDFNDLQRVDRLADAIAASKAKRLVVDHHLNPCIEADVLVSRPDYSSTSLLLFTLLEQSGLAIYATTDAATCCCAGMMTDTGNFAYNANQPHIYAILSHLMELGVDKDALYVKLFNTNTLERLRIMAYAQYQRMQILPGGHGALISLSADELHRMHYTKGDTEGLVNIPLSIPGITFSIFLREDSPGLVKVSMRSKGNFSVKHLCQTYFGGGGHLNASGGEYHGTLDEAIQLVMQLLPEANQMIKSL